MSGEVRDHFRGGGEVVEPSHTATHEPHHNVDASKMMMPSHMPADPDLAALDALYQAATWKAPFRVHYAADHVACDPVGIFDADDLPVADWMSAQDAERFVTILNALPALRRRLEIGDAAVEVVDAKEAWRKAAATAEAFLDHPHFSARRYAELVMFRTDAKKAHDAARSRLRALREAPDAA